MKKPIPVLGQYTGVPTPQEGITGEEILAPEGNFPEITDHMGGVTEATIQEEIDPDSVRLRSLFPYSPISKVHRNFSV